MFDLPDSVVLVTGGSGFIGSHLVDRLLNDGVMGVIIFDNFSNGLQENIRDAVKDPRVTVCKADLKDYEAVRKCLKGVDYVFHMGAVKHSASEDNAKELFDSNMLGTFNLLEACRSNDVKKIVFASSVYVYGVESKKPFSEDDPLLSRTLYGASKISGEQMLRVYYHKHGLKYVTLRYFFAYGPRLYQKNYQYAFVNKALDLIQNKSKPEVYGDGKQTFDYIYIDDAIQATILAMKSSRENSVYNVGTGKPTTILGLCKLLLDMTNSKTGFAYGPRDETYGTVRVADTSLAERELGFRASVPLREGIERVMAWRKGRR